MATPQLRFKEFDGDWSAVTLEDLAEVERGKFSVRPRNDPRYFGGEMPFVQTGDVTGSDVYLRGFTQTLNEDGVRVSKVFPADTILITIAANIGDTTITQYPVACPDSVVAIQPKHDKANTIFLKNIIDLQKDNLDSQATQNAQKNINLQVLKPLELIVPSKEEQTKIASFLSAVDEKISQLTQKHELLSQYKQGMMQKLFSQQIRFKADDGSEFGEWVSEKIAKAFTNKSKSFNPLLNESLPCIELEHLSQNTGQILGTVNSSDQQSTKNLFEPNSVLYGKLRPYLRKFAKPQFKGVCSSEIWVLTGLKISNNYLFQFIQSEQFTELTNIQSGSKMPRADWSVIADAEIEYPCIEEQTKIANFLSAIDQKIEVVAQQIEQAKQWKKGLLQQMFV
ncbi:restriction endonuclease subunit S [Acinetobacter sp. B51(2017)]|uniref:restriction endonuclease subunit S n=1 Tax=Acinetobacter sp. B51(2017) TaxID=2060938 RepID=UPI000F084BA0|nr:restriction endonuclease subunit S [Acinetobacter sp. B51(2017)]